MPGRVVVQWDKRIARTISSIKSGSSRARMMSLLEDSIAVNSRAQQEKIDRGLRPQYMKTFIRLCSRDIRLDVSSESRAQIPACHAINQNVLFDIVVQVASSAQVRLSEKVHPYLNRRQGREAVESLHSSAPNPHYHAHCAVPLFQAQLLRIGHDTPAAFPARSQDLLAPRVWISNALKRRMKKCKSSCARNENQNLS